jgi:hypothetical protein
VWYKLLLLAASLELGSAALLLQNSSSLAVLMGYFALHACASVFLAMAIFIFVPQNYHHPRRWLFAFLITYNFLMPIVGVLGTLTGVLLGLRLPYIRRFWGFICKFVPSYTVRGSREDNSFRSTRVFAQVTDVDMPLDRRLNALMSLQDTPTRITGGLLRKLLSDETDDVRLLAYGILDGKERQITLRIQDETNGLEKLTEADSRYEAHKRIGELYFELVYQDLVQGYMRLFSAEEARKHIALALHHHTDEDAGLYFMLGRLELLQGNMAEAEAAFAQAQQGHFTYERLLPHLLELRFMQRRFADVRALLNGNTQAASLPALMPVCNYWMPHETH